MAKLTARNNHRRALATSKVVTDNDGWRHKWRHALRSDGAILSAHDLLRPASELWDGVPESRQWNRGGYSINRLSDAPTDVAGFAAYFEARGYSVKIDR